MLRYSTDSECCVFGPSPGQAPLPQPTIRIAALIVPLANVVACEVPNCLALPPGQLSM